MTSKFHSVKVKEIRQETDDTVSVSLELVNGQKEAFEFTQGQYLTFKKDISGEEVRRSYSICSSVNDDELRVAIKQVENGKFSSFANRELKVGDTIEVMPPMGKFYSKLEKGNKKRYAAFAAGSGITPIMSIIKSTLEIEEDSEFVLFYGNKGVESIIFHEELEALKNIYLGRLSVHHILSRERLESNLFYGRISKEKTLKLSEQVFDPNSIDEYFLCGPYDMIMGAKEALEEKGVEKSKIHFELFTTPGEKIVRTKKTIEESFVAEITIQIDGNTIDVKMKNDEESILDTALKTGADLPFACKGGVCCTCKAKLEEGKIEMDVNYGLEEDEIEAGYILTCQARPITSKVAVNFDV